MDASIGVNLRVTAHSNQGGRRYMEDMFCVAYQPTADEKDLLYAYFGIFDGHGGREAALYAKTHLMDHIVSQKNFWSEDDELVLRSIKDGFISVHQAMWRELDKWPKTTSGLPSTSGTTASVAFVRRGKLYLGHVGDSGIVLGYQDPTTNFWKAKPLTTDHKPETPAENARIHECGGKVVIKSGVPRVVWNRPRLGHKGPVRRSTLIDEIPFLAVARSLGDLWSYNSEQNEFVVSPVPDTAVIEIDVNAHRCLILGSDGLWNMLNAQDAVNSVYFAEKNNERQNQMAAQQGHDGAPSQKNWMNPSKRLVDRALDRWYSMNLRADNTSVVTVVIDPPGPPRVPKPNSPRHSSSSISPERGSSTSRLTSHTNNRGLSPSNRFQRAIATTRYANIEKHSPPRAALQPSPQYQHLVPHSPQPQPEPSPQHLPRFPVARPGLKATTSVSTNLNRLRQQPQQTRDLPSRGKRAHPVLSSKTSRVMQARNPGSSPTNHSSGNQRTVAMSSSSALLATLVQGASGSRSSDDEVQINEVSSSCEESWRNESSDLDESTQVSSILPVEARKKLRKGNKRLKSVPTTASLTSARLAKKGRKRSSRQSITPESNEECSTVSPSKVLRLSSAADEAGSSSSALTRRTESQRLVMTNQSHLTVNKLRHSKTRDIRSGTLSIKTKSSTVSGKPVARSVVVLGGKKNQLISSAPAAAASSKTEEQSSPVGFTDILPTTSRVKPSLKVTKKAPRTFSAVVPVSQRSDDSSQGISRADKVASESSSSSTKSKTKHLPSTSGIKPLNQKNAISQSESVATQLSRSIALRTTTVRSPTLVNNISLKSIKLKRSKPELKRLQQGKKLPGSSAKSEVSKKDSKKKKNKLIGSSQKPSGNTAETREGRSLRSADIPPRMTRSQSVGRK